MPAPVTRLNLPSRPVSWGKRDVLLFNVSIGCKADELHFLYELHDKFAAFPTYPLALAFKGTASDMIDFYKNQSSLVVPGPPALDPRRLVDGERSIEFLKPLPVTSEGRSFEFRSRLIGVYDKGKAGTLVKSEDVLVDTASGEQYARIVGTLFYVGQGNWGGPSGPKAVQQTPPDRRPDAVFEVEVSQESAYLYRLNGDYNPLHALPEIGKELGFGGLILHGVYGFNHVAHDMVRLFGRGDPGSIKAIQARFNSWVCPGDRLRTSVWRVGCTQDGLGELRFVTEVTNRGKICLKDGKVLIQPAPVDDLLPPTKPSRASL